MGGADKPTLYQALVAAGVPTDHHESDLYVKATPEAQQILREYGHDRPKVFMSNTDTGPWYDLPFAYEPFWNVVRRRAEARD